MSIDYDTDADGDWYDADDYDHTFYCSDCGCPDSDHDYPAHGGGCHVCGIECSGWGDRPVSPQRIQLRRTKGWRKPEGAVVVSRPSKWGNPWTRSKSDDPARDLRLHLRARRYPWPGWVDLIGYPSDDEIRAELAGRDLACWCPLDQPCHADVLLEIANGGSD